MQIDHLKASKIGKAIYPTRVFGYWCAIAEVLISELFFLKYISVQAMVFMALVVIYPHLAYLLYVRRGGKRQDEFLNLILDMILIAWLASLLRFSPIVALPFVISNSATNYSTGGFALFVRGLGSFVLGCIVFGLINQFQFDYTHNSLMLIPSSIYMTLAMHYIAFLSFTRGEKILRSRQEILKQHEALEKSVKELNDTQTQLIQSEKLAVMGKLVASVAHEINTPLGAVRSSAGTIEIDLKETLKELPVLFLSLTQEQQIAFSSLLEKALENKPLSSKEERQARRALEQELTEKNIQNADNLAYDLINAGIYELNKSFDILLYLPNAPQVLKLAYHLVNQKRSTQNILLAVDKASKVIFALKNYARKDHTDEKVEASVVQGIEIVLMLYNSQIKQGVEVIKNLEDVPTIWCYPEELNQVWTNLIHNAIQAMNYKGILEISTQLVKNHVLVSVKDTGKGIDESIRERVFEAFFTTKPIGEGSGLGLDIVKKIVDKHKGKIYFETEVGKGTTFFVELPLKTL